MASRFSANSYFSLILTTTPEVVDFTIVEVEEEVVAVLEEAANGKETTQRATTEGAIGAEGVGIEVF